MKNVIEKIEAYENAVIAHEQARQEVQQFNRQHEQRVRELDDGIKAIQHQSDNQIAILQGELDIIIQEEKDRLNAYRAAWIALDEAQTAYKLEIQNLGARVAARVQRFPGNPEKWKAERGTPEE